MGNGAARTLERVAAAMGERESARIEFHPACDVAQGGVLLALPALLAAGLLRDTPEFYELPHGFYGIESIFLLLGLMALARIRSLEQRQAPGEWGKLLGSDRIPEVRSLRAKLKLLCQLIPDAISVVNPVWRTLDSQIRSKTGQRHRRAAQFGALALSEDPSDSQIQGFQQRKGQMREEIQALDWEIDKLKQQRKDTEHHIPVKSLPEEDRFTRLPTERKHFLDTLKMIAYRAETSMASLLREHMARGGDDAPALLRQIFQTEADLTPDLAANTLTIRLHHLTQAAHHQAIEQMLADLNATQTVFPGTTLTLVFKLGSA